MNRIGSRHERNARDFLVGLWHLLTSRAGSRRPPAGNEAFEIEFEHCLAIPAAFGDQGSSQSSGQTDKLGLAVGYRIASASSGTEPNGADAEAAAWTGRGSPARTN
jgi:hypothetical protein